jgi:hypothetical protein
MPNADERSRQILGAETDGVQHGAGSGAGRPVDENAAFFAGIVLVRHAALITTGRKDGEAEKALGGGSLLAAIFAVN